MWWPEANPIALRRVLRGAVGGIVLPMLIAAALTGCGFRPLYGTQSYNPNVMDDLASVEVASMADRQGQLVHNALLTALNPNGESPRPRYHLVTTLSVTETQQALRTDDTATRDVMTYSTTFWLYEDKTRILNGSFSQTYSYDFLEQHYANVSAADDIKKRAAQSIADEIRNRLAAYFAKAAEMKRAQAAPKP